jgi:hypothetical protein
MPVNNFEDRKLKDNIIVTDKQEFGTINLTDEIRAQAEKEVISRFTAVESARRERDREWDRFYRIYRNGEALSENNSRSNVFWPVTYNAVEDYVAQLMSVFGDLHNLIEVFGKRENLDVETKKAIKTILKENLRKAKFESELESIFRWGVVTGTFTLKCGWERKSGKVLRKVKDTKYFESTSGTIKFPLGFTRKVIEDVEIEDSAQFQYTDIRNLYFRPDKITWVIERIKTTWNDLSAMADKGLYDITEEIYKSSLPDDEFTNQDYKNDKDSTFEYLDNDVELLEAHHIPLMIKGKRVLCIVTLANRRVIRVQPTPYEKPPYLIVPFLPQRDSVYGRSLVETIEPLQTEINTRYQQTLDANSLGIYSMMAVNTRYLVDAEKDLKIRKNGVIRLSGTDRPISEIFQFLRPPTDHIAVSTNMIDRLLQMVQTTTRLKNVASGEKVSPTASATEIVSITKHAMKSMLLLFKRIDRDIVVEWFNRAYTMNVLNKETPWIVKVEQTKQNLFGVTTTSQNILEVLPEDIYTDGVDFAFIGITQERQAVDRMQDMQLLNLLSGLQGATLKSEDGSLLNINIHKLVTDVIRGFEKDNPEEYFIQAQEQGLPMEKGKLPQGPEVNTSAQGLNSTQDIAKSAVTRGEQGIREVSV